MQNRAWVVENCDGRWIDTKRLYNELSNRELQCRTA